MRQDRIISKTLVGGDTAKQARLLIQQAVDLLVLVAHQSIPEDRAASMDDVDFGGSGLGAAMQALILSRQGRALPDMVAVAFTMGSAFACTVSAGERPFVKLACQGFVEGIAAAIGAPVTERAKTGRN